MACALARTSPISLGLSLRPTSSAISSAISSSLRATKAASARESCASRHAFDLVFGPVAKSGRLDLNQRSPAPKAGALPGFATPRWCRVQAQPGLANRPAQRLRGSYRINAHRLCFNSACDITRCEDGSRTRLRRFAANCVAVPPPRIVTTSTPRIVPLPGIEPSLRCP